MYSHVMVGTNDVERSKSFYDALFGKPGRADDKGRLSYGRRGAVFMVSPPIDGAAAPATPMAGRSASVSTRPEEVDAWHAAGVEAGGTPIEDPPGWRENAFGKLYLAYLRDPDGNKLCGLHRPQQ